MKRNTQVQQMSHHEPTCECGVSYEIGNPENEKWHDRIHEEYLHGLVVPEVKSLLSIASKESLRLVVVDKSVEETIRTAVAQVAVVAQRCMSDFNCGYYGGASDEGRSLYALVNGTRIVGMAITSFEEHLRRFVWTPEGDFKPSETGLDSLTGPKITRIWIAASNRRHGLARWIIEEVGKHLNCNVPCLGWEMPLTKRGKSMVKSLCAEEFFGCGDLEAL